MDSFQIGERIPLLLPDSVDWPLDAPAAVLHPQGSAEWHADRLGHITGSRMIDVLGTPGAAASYALELIAERLTGRPAAEINTPALQWGKDCEPLAKEAYRVLTGRIITEVGFVKHPTIEWVGVSPDALFRPNGAEIKSPYNSTVHINTWRRNAVPDEHLPQVHSNIWVTESDWWDFISFDPRMMKKNPHLCLFVKRVYRDELYIKRMEEATLRLLAQIEVDMNKLHQRGHDMVASQSGEAA